ncbi:MAG: bifunctional riboflavin kinase/FAD synthetase [Thiotrichales bacterium]
MELIRGLYSLKPRHHGCVATIGNFDGVHRGHQAVLRQLAARGREFGLPATLITFDPLPQEFFLGDRAPARLTRLREKLMVLRALGVERVLVLPFNAKLAQTSAEDFVQSILVTGLGIQHLVVGDDFRFGKGRTGDYTLLVARGRQHGYAVERTETFLCAEGERMSSTRVREALGNGDFTLAERLLGQPYTSSGRVIHGDKRGRTLGFPTANLRATHRNSPLRGVFAVEVTGADLTAAPAVCNVGTRPTFDGRGVLTEVHLLNYTGDLYSRRLELRWRHKLRSEQKFASLDALRAQIARDIDEARSFFNL